MVNLSELTKGTTVAFTYTDGVERNVVIDRTGTSKEGKPYLTGEREKDGKTEFRSYRVER